MCGMAGASQEPCVWYGRSCPGNLWLGLQELPRNTVWYGRNGIGTLCWYSRSCRVWQELLRNPVPGVRQELPSNPVSGMAGIA